jgi:DNA primase
MLRYPLDEIRGKTDIVEFISTYVNLKRSGRTLKALCPFHTEKTPSFIVNEDLQKWHCYGCGEHGDIFSFLMKMENMTFSEAVQDIARKAGVNIQLSPAESKHESDKEKLLRINSAAASFFSGMLKNSQHALAYLRRRGVSDEAMQKYALGYAPAEWRALSGFLTSKGITVQEAERAGLLIESEKGTGHYDRFRDRIIFPIQDVTGKPVAFGGRCLGDEQPKYLNSPETPAFVKNRTLYGLNHARKSIAQEDRAIIVEGYLDVLTTQCAGFGHAVATMGTALTPEHVNLLSRYTHNVVIAFDSDSAGMSATLRSAPMFEQAGFDVRIACMPPGSDPDSMLREGDPAAFGEMLANALPLVEYRLKLLKEGSDLATDRGKAEMLKKAAPILGEVMSAVERDRYVRDLTQYHPNFATGATHAEESIRRDIETYRVRRGRPAPTGHKTPVKPESPKMQGSALLLAEKYLLRAIITEPHYGDMVFAELTAQQFASPEAKALVCAIMERLPAKPGGLFEDLTEAMAGTEAAKLLSELVVAEYGPETSEQAVVDCMTLLSTNWKRQRLKELAARVERGELRSTDEEFAEYWRLVQELHNTVQKK